MRSDDAKRHAAGDCSLAVWTLVFFPANQVIFEVLLRKGDLVEKFVAFASKPRLLHRFRERLADYKRFWEGVQVGHLVSTAWSVSWSASLSVRYPITFVYSAPSRLELVSLSLLDHL